MATNMSMVEKDMFILHTEYHCCSWPADTRSQGINSYVTDKVFKEHFGLWPRKLLF